MLDNRLLALERLDLRRDVLSERIQAAELCIGVLAQRVDLRKGLELALEIGHELGRLGGVGACLQ